MLQIRYFTTQILKIKHAKCLGIYIYIYLLSLKLVVNWLEWLEWLNEILRMNH